MKIYKGKSFAEVYRNSLKDLLENPEYVDQLDSDIRKAGDDVLNNSLTDCPLRRGRPDPSSAGTCGRGPIIAGKYAEGLSDGHQRLFFQVGHIYLVHFS